jgi:NADH-quinone oxidoreductase subunit G
MPKLIIDEQEIEVSPGTKVIEAAEQLGIVIPRFCYHPALGPVGACRVCAVKCLQGPFKGVQMSCMIDAVDGMVISTTDEEAVDFRKYVIEWLMLHHPHDCPVCDEGGHCLLQDMTVAGGHGIRRYRGRKRTHHDQYLGPLIQHEMNRCIQCYRCSRFYQEFAGYRDLGVLQIGNRVCFGRYKEGTLESPFAGNLIDICPTGVYTDKPSRFIGRRWDFERSPSVCINCSLGCHTVVSARYREVVRQESRFSEVVNGHFICDRGRYGFSYTNQVERPRQARIDGKEATWKNALQTASERLSRLTQESGPAAVACVGSVRSGLETQAALKRLCQAKDWQGPVFWMNHDMERKVKTAVLKLKGKLAFSLRDLEHADYILAVGIDPINEAPMLAVAMRQAQRRGAKVLLLDPRPIHLPFNFDHLPVVPQVLDLYLALLVKETVDPDTVKTFGPHIKEFFNAISDENRISISIREMMTTVAKDLQLSQRPVIVCGTDIVSETTPELAGEYARILTAEEKQAGLFYLLPGANAFGAALLSDAAAPFEQILANIETGAIRALVMVESDPYWHFPDRLRLERAFERLDLVIVLDYLDSRIGRDAHVFLPTLTLYESGGFFMNQEGRVQNVPITHRGGHPISQISEGNHPLRSFRDDIPGREAQPAWQALAEMTAETPKLQKKEMYEDLLAWLVEAQPLFGDFPPVNAFPDTGVRLSLGQDIGGLIVGDRSTAPFSKSRPFGDLELITVDWTFGTEELSARSPHLRQMEKEPCFFMHSHDATELGLSHGDKVVIRLNASTISAPVAVVRNMASGILVLPRHREIDWQHLGAFRTMLRRDQILKVSEDE